MKSHFVSVIVPTYNRAELLKESIESVLEQRYKNFELLILDDFSTDNTSDIVAGFQDSRIKYIRHLCNIGLVANWTYGVNWAKGTFFSILGDDDKYRPEFLYRRIEVFDGMPELVAATGSFECCDINDKRIRMSRLPCDTQKVFAGRELMELTLGFSGEWFNGATLYKTNVVRSMWNRICMAGTALDFSMHIRLSLLDNVRIIFLNDNNMILRIHAGQESQRNSLYLAESAANLALQMWSFEIGGRNKYRDLFRKRFSADINDYARKLWDAGYVEDSRNMHRKELTIMPFQVGSWLRFLRTFFAYPRTFDDSGGNKEQ